MKASLCGTRSIKFYGHSFMIPMFVCMYVFRKMYECREIARITRATCKLLIAVEN